MQRIPKVCMHARVLTHIYTHTLLLVVLLLQLYYNFNARKYSYLKILEGKSMNVHFTHFKIMLRLI